MLGSYSIAEIYDAGSYAFYSGPSSEDPCLLLWVLNAAEALLPANTTYISPPQ